MEDTFSLSLFKPNKIAFIDFEYKDSFSKNDH